MKNKQSIGILMDNKPGTSAPEATRCILQIIKAAGHESVALEALKTLVALSHSASHYSVSNCSVEMGGGK